ncbi:MAG: serine/threonine-protein kinase, partial [Acidobacteriota bacterium]
MAPKSPFIGPYRLGDRLGHGGMGEVYRAYDRRLDREVAIKVIRRDGAGRDAVRSGRPDPGPIRRFRREARSAAGLDHPAIVQVHDILETADGGAIVMELVRGTDLSQRRRDPGLSVAGAVDVLRQVAAGLAAAHDSGWVHRDLKAENVMLRPDGRVKILDFGVAILEREPQGDGPVGTYRAMSPEQARGLEVDARSDLFSLGVLAYELLADRSPFVADAPRDTLRNVCVLRQAPLDEVVPDVPVDLARLVDRLLEKNPARRPAGAAEVRAGLEAIADGLGDGPGSLPPSVAPGPSG